MQEGSFKAFHNVKPALQEMLQAALRCLNPRDLARGEKMDVTATVRVKCTVTERGRIINLKQVCVLNSVPQLFQFELSSNMTYMLSLPGQLQTTSPDRQNQPHLATILLLVHWPGLHWRGLLGRA